jgi:hypothetical protein
LTQCFADYLRRWFLYCRLRNARHTHHVHAGVTSTAQLTGGHKCVTRARTGHWTEAFSS